MKKLAIVVLILVSTFGLFAQGTITNGTLSFPEGTTAIKNSAYQTNQDVKHINFPLSLKTIGTNAFRFCVYIDDDLVLPDGLESIGNFAFYNCVNVHKITVPASVTTIGDNAFCKNASLVVKKNSAAHRWAVANGYDYQFTSSGLPEGVTEVYQDFFMKTAWYQRGGKLQFAPNRERTLCGNLADATIMFYNGLNHRGSKSYSTSEGIYYADFDEPKPDLAKIPRYFPSSYTDEQMYDADLFLWYQCVTGETKWGNSTLQSPGGYIDLESEHMPVKIGYYRLKLNDTETGAGYYTKAEIEAVIKENMTAKHPMMMYARNAGGDSNHGWVIDGMRKKNGVMQVHCNFGWNGGCDGWCNIWDPIVNSMINYTDPYRHFRSYIPLTGSELTNWKPRELTDAQKSAVKAETAQVPYIKNSIVYVPEGSTVAYSKSYQNNKSIKGIKFPSTLRRIGTSAYEGTNITELTIPESVEYISNSAFKDCKNLKTLYFNAVNCTYSGASSGAFKGCDNLTKVVIGNKVKTIPLYTFRYCTNLKEITIPASVDSIGNYAFASDVKIDCSAGSYAETWAREKNYTLVNGVSSISGTTSGTTTNTTSSQGSLVDGVLTIASGVTQIATRAYVDNAEIVSLIIPNSVKTIGAHAFQNCKNLLEVTIPSSVTEIKTSAFNGSGLQKVIIEEGCKTLGAYAFHSSKSLTEITLPASLTKIETMAVPKTAKVTCPAGSYAETWARQNGNALANGTTSSSGISTNGTTSTTINNTSTTNSTTGNSTGSSASTIQNGVLTIASGTTQIASRAYAENTEIKSVIIPNSVKTIETYAFMACKNLTEITIPSSVTDIKTSAFNGSGLQKVVIEEGCKNLAAYAFYGSNSLGEITLPASLTSIGKFAIPTSTRIRCPLNSFAESWVIENKMALLPDYTLNNGVLTFSEGMTILSPHVFEHDNISKIVFPKSLKTIGEGCFMYCINLESLTIPSNVTTIEKEAFGNCINLRKIIIPETVTSIGENAICRNTSMVVKRNSYAHNWAVENGRDYQFTESGLPEGVTEVYTDYFVKTMWNQRGGRNQLVPRKRYIVCGNLANVTILYWLGLKYQGSTCFATKEGTYYLDMDKNVPDYDKIPMCFYSGYSNEKMYDADLLLFEQGMVYKLDWLRDPQGRKYPGWLAGMMEHAPAKITSYTTDSYTHKQLIDMLKRNFAAGRPVWMWASTTGNAHAFVVDGLRMKDGKVQVHCNFGFTGKDDGWKNIWEKILVFDKPFRHFVEWIPLEGEELKNWKPYRLTQEQVNAIEAETTDSTTIVNGVVHVPAGNNFILPNEFKDNTKIKSVELPITLRAIGGTAFEGCSNLTQITIPKYTESLADYIFRNCTKLKTVNLNQNLETMGIGVFTGCSSLKTITIPSSLKALNYDVFSGCSSLTEITIPENIAKIMQRAFMNCTSLKTVYYNATNSIIVGVGANSPFNGCSALTKIVVGNNVQSIPSQIFEQCTALTEVVIPASVTSIGRLAIPKTAKVTCPAGSYAETWARQNGNPVNGESATTSNTSVSGGTTSNESTTVTNNSTSTSQSGITNGVLTIAEGTTKIASRAYSSNAEIVSVVIPSSVKIIDSYAFMACKNIAEITIPSSVTEIKVSAFNGSGLKKVVINEGCTTLGAYAFHASRQLTEITLPASLSNIGIMAIPKTAKVICPAGSYAETWAKQNGNPINSESSAISSAYTSVVTTSNIATSNAAVSNATTNNTTTVSTSSAPSGIVNGVLTIADGTTKIASRAYTSNAEIVSVVIPNSVKIIDSYAFMACKNIAKITIPSSITEIKVSAFNGSGLKKVVINEGCTTLGAYAFHASRQLTEITLPASLSNIGIMAIPKTAKVICPAGSYAETWAKQNGNEFVNN